MNNIYYYYYYLMFKLAERLSGNSKSSDASGFAFVTLFEMFNIATLALLLFHHGILKYRPIEISLPAIGACFFLNYFLLIHKGKQKRIYDYYEDKEINGIWVLIIGSYILFSIFAFAYVL